MCKAVKIYLGDKIETRIRLLTPMIIHGTCWLQEQPLQPTKKLFNQRVRLRSICIKKLPSVNYSCVSWAKSCLKGFEKQMNANSKSQLKSQMFDVFLVPYSEIQGVLLSGGTLTGSWCLVLLAARYRLPYAFFTMTQNRMLRRSPMKAFD